MEHQVKKTIKLIEKATPAEIPVELNLLTCSPSQTISFEIEEKQSVEEQSFNVNASSNGSALKHRFEGENLEV